MLTILSQRPTFAIIKLFRLWLLLTEVIPRIIPVMAVISVIIEMIPSQLPRASDDIDIKVLMLAAEATELSKPITIATEESRLPFLVSSFAFTVSVSLSMAKLII